MEIFTLLDDIPLEHWLDGGLLPDDVCYGPVMRARAEFKGHSENQVRKLWNELHPILGQWLNENPITRPTYRPPYHIENRDGKEIMDPSRRGDPVTYWSPVFSMARKKKYPPLLIFLRKLHSNSNISMCKAFALLILFEASSGHSAGVIAVARVWDGLNGSLLPLRESALAVQRGRRKGGKIGAARKAKDAAPTHDLICESARKYLAAGKKPHELASIIAPRYDRSPHTVRDILQKNGILKKRT